MPGSFGTHRFRWGSGPKDRLGALGRAVAIPLVNPKDVAFVSKRVGNFQRHPVLGMLISRLWVR